MEFYNKRIVKKPRKSYVCELCGGKINDKHYYIATVQDGDFFADRCHITCHDKIQDVCNACEDSQDCQHTLIDCFNEYCAGDN